MSEEASQPSYPPLHSCVLIDSRLSSRTELRSYIQSTNLFETLIEPESLDEGLKVILADEIDTCIFGPSLKSEKIRNFLKDLELAEHNSSCAFLSVTREGTHETIQNLHNQIEFPCTKKAFNAGIIKALQNANGGDFPAPKKTNPITGEPLYIKDILSGMELEEDFGSTSSQYRSLEIFSRQSTELAQALANLDPHYLMFKANGTPTGVTTEIIRGIISDIFPSRESDDSLTIFKNVLEQLLYFWVQDATQYGKKTANLKLKESIVGYFTTQKEL